MRAAESFSGMEEMTPRDISASARNESRQTDDRRRTLESGSTLFWQQCRLCTGSDATVSGFYTLGIMPLGDGLVREDTGLIIPYVSPN